MTKDNNDPYLYHEQAETWQRETNIADRLHLVEQQLAAVIADNADLRRCLQYVSERAGIQDETLAQHNHRLIALEAGSSYEARTRKEKP